MRNLSGFILLLVFIVACSEKRPSDILPQEKMREVMWDMLKASEFLDGYVLNYDSSVNRVAETKAWYEQVYRLHKITKTQFDKSYAYYREHPLLMKEMLDSLGKREVSDTGINADTTAKFPADTTIKPSADTAIKPSPNTPIPAEIVKDSFKRRHTPTINPITLPAQEGNRIIDSIRKARLLQRKQRLEQ
jgi:hypothetical protein